MAKKALIIWGGWEGHQPQQVAEVCRQVLAGEGFDVEISHSLDSLADEEKLRALSLIIPVWTTGKITPSQLAAVTWAVREAGVGIGGCHGGMCDAFRDAIEWHFMTGGQWVAHPGNDTVAYTISITAEPSPITQGIKDFGVITEQYYMHVDPGVKVLATTRFPVAEGPHVPNGAVEMPVVWTKMYGNGRVFYDALGHTAETVASEPNLTLMRRGLLWAAR